MPKKQKPTIESLVWMWKDAGGEYSEFSQAANLCVAMCQYWVTYRFRGMSSHQLMILMDSPHLRSRIQTRQRNIDASMSDIPGTQRHHIAGKFIGAGTLRGRNDMMKLLFSTRGVYVFGATPAYRMGHALAFDTTSPDLYFFDPNCGQFWFSACNATKDHFFRTWFFDFWEVSGYKDEYHSGDKDLKQYTLHDAAQLMT